MLDDGRADAYYQKFTTPKVGSMILGNSKAGQNILPSILNEELKGFIEEPVYNFAFSLYDSPYGDLYSNVIKRKLKENAKSSIFIITVDPWSISGPKGTPNDPSTFEEGEKFVRDMYLVDINPNPFFLYKHYHKSFYEILIQRIKPGKSKIHSDGWWETEDFKDSLIVKSRTEHLIKTYSEYSKNHEYSEYRVNELKKLILYLKEKGHVYVVRMPLNEKLFEIEEKAIPNFNETIIGICSPLQINFTDLNIYSEELFFEDGLHLDKDSSVELSKIIAKLIKEDVEYNVE